MKTEASQKPVPMDGALAAVLHCWSAQTWYRQPGDWVLPALRCTGSDLMAGDAAEMLFAARCKTPEYHEANWLAPFPQNVCEASQEQRWGCEDRSGTDATCKQQIDAGRVRTS